MKQRILRCIMTISFQVGVSVLGIPDFHYHNLAIYKTEQVKRFSKWI